MLPGGRRKTLTILMFALHFGTIEASKICSWSIRSANLINSCPITPEDRKKATFIKNCEALAAWQDCSKPSVFKYHCVLSDLDNFVEICAPEKYIKSGNCIIFNTQTGQLESQKNKTCLNASRPCPRQYLSSNSFRYPFCYGFNDTNLPTETTTLTPLNGVNMSWKIPLSVCLSVVLFVIGFAIVICVVVVRQRRSKLKEMTIQTELELSARRLSDVDEEKSTLNEEKVLMQGDEGGEISDERESKIRGNLLLEMVSGDQEEFWKLVLNQKKWNILILILMSEKYSILCEETSLKEKIGIIQQTFPTLHDSDNGISDNLLLIKELVNSEKILTMNRENNSVEFISEDIRHQVMGYFVLNCLKADEDYNNFVKLASLDLLFEYARTIGYERKTKERCVFLPRTTEETLIRKIGIDIVRHVTVDDDDMKDSVYETLNIPREILAWDLDARCRYVQCAKKGTQTIHRARAMIVGCAGAGKTTLLKRLEKRSLDELKQVQSTLGLEVHEDIFEILKEKDYLRALTEETDKEGKELLSVMDFGGQCAYYACHQVYLSRRAFYLLVIDMSKSFDEKVDPALCEKEGTMFADWTYGEYLLFWLKSVHTYCDNDAPVIIVGTHLDRVKKLNADTFYNNILDHLKYNKYLKAHLNRNRCFALGFQTDGKSFIDSLSELEKCIVAIAKEERWKETIPTDWALCEVVFRESRRQGISMTSLRDLVAKCFGGSKEKYAQIGDILKFYHDIGVILYFKDNNLSETVIIDIQWFIDSFKNLITDPNHVRDLAENSLDWWNFYRSGHILDRLLTGIWSNKRFYMNFWDRNNEKTNLLQYMQRLGLIAVGTYAHYIPCMNKRAFGISEEYYFQSLQSKTSVLVFRFQFLPCFFYYRLIVACLTRTNGEWMVLEDCLYKNMACFAYKQHVVALAVNNSSIQLQIFQPTNVLVIKEVALEVRDTVESLLKELLGHFHKKIDMYTVGYQCKYKEVFREHDNCFIEEKDIYKKGKIMCPRHGFINHHELSESSLLGYWKMDVITEISDLDDLMDQDECTRLTEPELRKMNFESFEKLTKIGRDALQLYFDRIVSPVDLVTMLTTNKDSLQRGQFKLNQDQCTLLFPANKSVPTSSAFDVTIMYKLLRNYGPNILPPTNGWGKKPEIGQKLPTDDVERIRIYRNEVAHKTQTTNVLEKDNFDLKWRDLSQAILRLSNGSLKQDIMTLRRQR